MKGRKSKRKYERKENIKVKESKGRLEEGKKR